MISGGVVEGILDTKFQLRAERAGDGPGRNYAVTYLAVDDQGIPNRSITEIFVPHDQGGVSEPLMISARNTEAGTRLDWSPVPEARFYNAIRGEMSGIREHKDYFHLGKGECVGSGLTDPTKVVMEDQTFPAIGEVYFYLVEYDDGRRSGFGTVTAAKERFLPSGLGNCP